MNEVQRNKIRMIIREELYSLVEGRNKFDPEKVLQLVSKDKFLGYEWKKLKFAFGFNLIFMNISIQPEEKN